MVNDIITKFKGKIKGNDVDYTHWPGSGEAVLIIMKPGSSTMTIKAKGDQLSSLTLVEVRLSGLDIADPCISGIVEGEAVEILEQYKAEIAEALKEKVNQLARSFRLKD